MTLPALRATRLCGGPDNAMKNGNLRGDKFGLTISKLGANAIWMTPIFDSSTASGVRNCSLPVISPNNFFCR